MRSAKVFVSGVVVVSAVFLAACGGTDPSPAVDKLNKMYTSQLQAGLEKGGATAAQAGTAAITIKCPDSVDDSKPFDCTVTGSPSGKSLDLEMQIKNDALEPLSTARQDAVLNQIILSEAKAVANQS